MFHLIRKDLQRQGYLLLVGVIAFLLTLLIPAASPKELQYLPLTMIVVTVILLGVIFSETTEEKNQGYELLSTLPLARITIVGTKFLLIFLESLLFSLIAFLILTLKNIVIADGIQPLSLASFSFIISILLGSLFYSGAYLIGMKTFTKVMLVLIVAMQGYIFILSVETFAGGIGLQKILSILNRILLVNPVFLIVVTLFAWCVLLLGTAQFRKQI